MVEYVIDHDPIDSNIKLIETSLREYNRSRTGFSQPKPRAVYLRNDGKIEGGIVFVSMKPWAYIKLLWVSDNLRGKGYGAKLLATAEDEARALGSTKMMLDTFSFQAPKFYEKQGYSEISRIEGYPSPGVSRFWFSKEL